MGLALPHGGHLTHGWNVSLTGKIFNSVQYTVDPNTGIMCAYQNDKGNKGYWLGEYDLGEKTIYPEIERLIFALGQPQQYVRKPNTGTVATAPTTSADYQALLAYNAQCGEYNPPTSFIYPSED